MVVVVVVLVVLKETDHVREKYLLVTPGLDCIVITSKDER